MSDQLNLNINIPKDQEPIDSVNDYKFEPIKGYPMLNWKGKRAFTSTSYYPAQLKERHGEEVDGWLNKIFWGDNLQVMSHLLKHFRGKVNLVYIDPPFDSKADYKKKISLKGQQITNDLNSFEEKQYTDIWSNDEYLQFMYERLILIRELLADDGFIFVHLNADRVHYIKILLDEIFGNNNFRNEILVKRIKKSSTNSQGIHTLNEGCDNILCFAKTEKPKFIPPLKYSPKEERWHGFDAPNIRPNLTYKLFGYLPPVGRCWLRNEEEAKSMIERGDLRPHPKTGKPEYKLAATDYIVRDSLWDDITSSSFKTGYPTEKKEEMIEQIIGMASHLGDIVFDCFMGSGTTQAVAMKLGRRFIGADINFGAVQITTKRLLSVASELNQKNDQQKLDVANDENKPNAYYTGFEVYNVNHYDVFRNPIDARELLLQALEIEKLSDTQLFHGERDGRMYYIMPVNRIATQADLSELITGFDYKAFERRQAEHLFKPVEKITLVCMGHEPLLADKLKAEVLPYKIDVEVVDILRDKQDIQFKRDSEAVVNIKGKKLVIEKFYPMNLLAKLSKDKSNVEDWRELVESIMIDWNYDGAVLEPAIVDIPEKKEELVKGTYDIPKGAGTIRVKITDLLSESLEIELQND